MEFWRQILAPKLHKKEFLPFPILGRGRGSFTSHVPGEDGLITFLTSSGVTKYPSLRKIALSVIVRVINVNNG